MPTSSNSNRRSLYKGVSALAALFIASLAAHGQGQPTGSPSQVAAPAFDVVSVKPDKSGSGGMSSTGVTDSFKGTNLRLNDLVMDSYNLTSYDLIFGLPGWAREAHFDIDAKIVNPDRKQIDNLTDDQRRAMILGILKDRFHFQAHLEARTLPVYDLVVAKGGPKFTGGKNRPDAVTAAALAKRNITNGGMVMYDGEVTAMDTPLSTLVFSLTDAVGRTVVDKTGLTGKYTFELKWAPEHEAQANADSGQADAQTSAPSIFTAVEEELGLKLQSAKGPVQTLVVDHVEMPTEN